MEQFTRWILTDREPSLGVTEPGAIAFGAATARQYVTGAVTSVSVAMTSGLYKNSFTCGIPNTTETGSQFSAALGVLAGKPEKGLLALEDITEADVAAAEEWIAAGKVTVTLSEITSHLKLEATVTSATETATVTIEGSHTNITSIVVNGETVLSKEAGESVSPAEEAEQAVTHYTLSEFLRYCDTVPFAEIAPLKEGYGMNLALAQAALESDRAVLSKGFVQMNGGHVFSANVLETAQVLTAAALEARVIGLGRPAMSITGSGAHGIICTMPLYAIFKCHRLTPEQLCRATALSYLVTMYLKGFAGRLSAYCGCGIAAGTGMAAALTYLMGGDQEQIECTISNMACGITGMICDGGNTGCVLKAMTAVDAAYRSAKLGMNRLRIGAEHGINGATIEETMQNMGRIADPGMRETERTIVELLEKKRT